MTHLALSGTGSRRLAALADSPPRRLLDGQHALMAIVAGVTWLALVGGALSSAILSNGGAATHRSHSLPAYVAYNMQEQAPTSFGSLSVYRADMASLGDLVEVRLSLRVDNTHDAPIDAPRVEDLRLINSVGREARPEPGGWRGPAVLAAHSSTTVDLTYVAPSDLGLMWLEYRDPELQWPIRVVLGSAPAPQPAARLGLGGVA